MERFLHKKLPNLQQSPEVSKAVQKSRRLTGEKVPNRPEDRIGVYLKRLEKAFLNPDTRIRERNIDMVRPALYDSLLIKPEAVPESYFELQKRVARERGQPVENIPPDMREQMIETAIEDQRSSLDAWVDYLSSSDAVYPAWFKYFVFRNVAKLSQFDKELGKFKERTDSTVAPFPDIYREPLAQLCDIYERGAQDKSLLEDPAYQDLISKKFPAAYAELVQQTLENSLEHKENIAGEWVTYKQGDMRQAHKLYESLQGKGTGWCTAGESTARAQVESGDFHVYYTYDKSGAPVDPRIAIRTEEGRIGEVRGILPHQELEPALSEVLDEKLKSFGSEADRYKKKSADMRRLTTIEHTMGKGLELSRSDLLFLYEVDAPIEGFGYDRDPRIRELRGRRNEARDMEALCACEPEHIARAFADIAENTQVYLTIADGKVTLFDYRLPENKNKLGEHMAFARQAEEAGSSARLDLALEGGIAPVSIERGKKMRQLVEEGKYDWVNDDFIKIFKTVEQGPQNLTALLVDFGKYMHSEEVIAELDKLGLRPLTAAEALAVGAQHPDLQRKQPLVALGSVAELEGDRRVPYLGRDGALRVLRLYWWDLEWDDICRFLAVRK